VEDDLGERTYGAALTPIPVSRTVSVRRHPGGRGAPDTVSPMSNGWNEEGKSTPSSPFPKTEAAQNNKWNCPRRIKPTSPILIRVSCAGAGSLEVAIFQIFRYRLQRENDELPQGFTESKEVHLPVKGNL